MEKRKEGKEVGESKGNIPNSCKNYEIQKLREKCGNHVTKFKIHI